MESLFQKQRQERSSFSTMEFPRNSSYDPTGGSSGGRNAQHAPRTWVLTEEDGSLSTVQMEVGLAKVAVMVHGQGTTSTAARSGGSTRMMSKGEEATSRKSKRRARSSCPGPEGLGGLGS